MTLVAGLRVKYSSTCVWQLDPVTLPSLKIDAPASYEMVAKLSLEVVKHMASQQWWLLYCGQRRNWENGSLDINSVSSSMGIALGC